MSLRYRSIGGAKVLVDSGDTTPDFLSPKLLVGSGLIKNILNPGGNEQIQLVNSGVLQLLAGTDILLAPAGGTGIVTVSVDVSSAGLDGRYVKRSPSGENQQILPLTNNIPLTLKGFPGGTSKLLDIFDSTSPTQLEKWFWDSSANLNMLGSPSPALKSGAIGTLLQVNVFGALVFGGAAGEPGDGTQQWQFRGGSIIFVNTTPGFGIAVNAIAKANNTPSSTTDWLLFVPATNEVDIGFTGPLVLFGNKIDNTNNLMQFLSFIAEQLAADPAVNTAGRLYERTDLVQLSWNTGTVVRRILDSASISALLPPTVDTTGQTAGTATTLSASDHKHQLANPLTSSGTGVNLGANFLDLSAISVPVAPGVNVRRVFVVATGNLVSAETSAGTLVYLEGRGAPNVAVAKAATSLAITLSPAEPDTSYEIGVMPAFNSTVYYSAKATTGFTINFGTSPGAASTLDWTVDRRVSGSA